MSANQHIEYATVTTGLRAPRVAVVFPAQANWDYFARAAMYAASNTWGGAGFVLVPATDGNIDHACEMPSSPTTLTTSCPTATPLGTSTSSPREPSSRCLTSRTSTTKTAGPAFETICVQRTSMTTFWLEHVMQWWQRVRHIEWTTAPNQQAATIAGTRENRRCPLPDRQGRVVTLELSPRSTRSGAHPIPHR